MSASDITAVLSDPHLSHGHVPTLRTWVELCRAVKPRTTVFNGDLINCEGLAKFTPDIDEHQPYVVPQIQHAVRFVNRALEWSQDVAVLVGNHEGWWSRTVLGAAPHALRGAIGLTLEAQFRAQGLDPRVHWVEQSLAVDGVWIGPRDRDGVLIQHGHLPRQGGFGGSVIHKAHTIQVKSNGRNIAHGHSHIAQIVYHNAYGRLRFGCALPMSCDDMVYATATDRHRGFAIFEQWDCGEPDIQTAPSVLVTRRDGSVAWGGTVWTGSTVRPEEVC